MTMIYRWECDNSIKDILGYLENNLDRRKYRLNIHEKEISISFPLSKEFNRYYFKGKLKEKNDKVELRGVFSISSIMNQVLLVLSVGFFFLILCDLLPISLVDIFFIMFLLSVLIVANLIFYFITISCHNWSLYFGEDRENFLKILDNFLVRKR